jgi:hypothetical protein
MDLAHDMLVVAGSFMHFFMIICFRRLSFENYCLTRSPKR